MPPTGTAILNRDKVLAAIANSGPLCDLCLTRAAGLLQVATSNQEARLLEGRGRLARVRDRCPSCGKVKLVNRMAAGIPATSKADVPLAGEEKVRAPHSSSGGGAKTREAQNAAAAKQRENAAPRPSNCMANGTVVLVACAATKRHEPSPAKDLYVSDHFAKSRRYAEHLGAPWFILSAEHGLLDPDSVVAPYDKTLNTMPVRMRREWADRIVDKLRRVVPEARRVVFLAGNRYREHLIPLLRSRGIETELPMEGLRIGEQLSWLARHTR